MAKNETANEQLAILRTENKQQTKSIDEIKVMLSSHVGSSDTFRDKCLKNETDIKWIKRIALFIFSSGGLLALGWRYLKTKFGG